VGRTFGAAFSGGAGSALGGGRFLRGGRVDRPQRSFRLLGPVARRPGDRRFGHPLPFHLDLLGEENLQVLGHAAAGRTQVEPENALLDIRLHVGARLVPVFGILGEGLGDDVVQLLGKPALQRPERGELGLPHLRKDLEGVVSLEHAAARDQFIQENPGGEDVGPEVDHLSRRLFGRHVGDFSLDHPHLGDRALAGRLGDPEIDDLHIPLVGEEDVLGRDVPMDDVQGFSLEVLQLVRVIEPGAHLGDQVQGVFEADRGSLLLRFRVDRPQILPEEKLHRDEVRIFHRAEVVDLDDVLVIQEGGQLRLVDEGGDELLLVREVGKDLLDGDELLEPLDADDLRPVQLGHPARSEFFDQEILSETGGLEIGHVPLLPYGVIRSGMNTNTIL